MRATLAALALLALLPVAAAQPTYLLLASQEGVGLHEPGQPATDVPMAFQRHCPNVASYLPAAKVRLSATAENLTIEVPAELQLQPQACWPGKLQEVRFQAHLLARDGTPRMTPLAATVRAEVEGSALAAGGVAEHRMAAYLAAGRTMSSHDGAAPVMPSPGAGILLLAGLAVAAAVGRRMP